MSISVPQKEHVDSMVAIRKLKAQLSETRNQIIEHKIESLKAENAMLKKKHQRERDITKESHERELATTNKMIAL